MDLTQDLGCCGLDVSLSLLMSWYRYLVLNWSMTLIMVLFSYLNTLYLQDHCRGLSASLCMLVTR